MFNLMWQHCINPRVVQKLSNSAAAKMSAVSKRKFRVTEGNSEGNVKKKKQNLTWLLDGLAGADPFTGELMDANFLSQLVNLVDADHSIAYVHFVT